jgi:hypothetical protein
VLIVTAPWGEAYSDRLAVRAGKPTSLKIVCPSGADMVTLPVKIEWPAGFEPPADVWVAGQAIPEDQKIDGREWHNNSEPRRFLTNARGQTIEFPSKSIVGGDWIVSNTLDRSDQYRSWMIDVKSGEPAAVDREPTLQLPKGWEGPVVLRMVAVTKSDNWHFTKLNDTAQLRLEWQPGPEPHWVVKIPPEVVADVTKGRDKVLLGPQGMSGWADNGFPPPPGEPLVPTDVESSAPRYYPPGDGVPQGLRTVPEPSDEEPQLPPAVPDPLEAEPGTPAKEEPGRLPDSVRARSPGGRG